jgi:hypothetical protein
MSFIQNLFSSRDNNANTETYVGQTDRIWYNPDNNTFRVSDGNTPGGLPIDYSSNANVDINSLTVNTVTVNTAITSTGGNINFTGNLVISGNISAAAAGKIGGIQPGPGVNISNVGLLTLDSANIPFSFGNFTANNNILTIVNVNEDMILETSGNAEIQLVGNVGFYKPNGGGVPDPNALFFFARDDGQLTILVPAEDPLLGAVEIIGSATGNLITPGQPGAMLHITGNPGLPARMYLDGNGEYTSFVARRFNGNVAVPTQVLAGQDVFRLNSTAATNAGMGNVAMAQIRTTALENQTTTAQGSSITFTVTPVGSSASARVDVANVTVANGVTATKFTTAGTISATGNITGGNVSASTFTGNVVGNVTGTASTATSLAAATSILAGSLTINPTNIGKTSASTQTFTLTGLTTSHKIVIMPGTVLTYGITISAAWASALNTLSIEFQNGTGGGVDLGNIDIQYFAWV